MASASMRRRCRSEGKNSNGDQGEEGENWGAKH